MALSDFYFVEVLILSCEKFILNASMFKARNNNKVQDFQLQNIPFIHEIPCVRVWKNKNKD